MECTTNSKPEQLQLMQQMLEEKIDDIFEELEISVRRNYKMYVGICPVHLGNNQAAFNLYHNQSGDGVFNWRCNTKHCESHFKKTILGLIRGMLSQKIHGWKGEGDREVSFPETLKWCEDFLKVNLKNLKIEDVDLDKQQFINRWLNKTKIQTGNNDFLLQGLLPAAI